ncbi:MAG: 3-methyladenine DNA glycosylase 2, partial [Candidatus Dormibacteraceae bacterium]
CLDRGAKLDELVASLVALPGLGPWTAHYIALRLGEPDAFPITDLVLLRTLKQLTSREITPPTVVQLAEPWRPWRSQAAIQLWLSAAG